MKSGKEAVKSRLKFCEALITQIKERKANLKTEVSRSMLNQILAGKILKKYKVMRQAKSITSSYIHRNIQMK